MKGLKEYQAEEKKALQSLFTQLHTYFSYLYGSTGIQPPINVNLWAQNLRHCSQGVKDALAQLVTVNEHGTVTVVSENEGRLNAILGINNNKVTPEKVKKTSEKMENQVDVFQKKYSTWEADLKKSTSAVNARSTASVDGVDLTALGVANQQATIPTARVRQFINDYTQFEKRGSKILWGAGFDGSNVISGLRRLCRQSPESLNYNQVLGIIRPYSDKWTANYVDVYPAEEALHISGTQRVIAKINQYFARKKFLQDFLANYQSGNRDTALVAELERIQQADVNLLAIYKKIDLLVGQKILNKENSANEVKAFDAAVSNCAVDPFRYASQEDFFNSFIIHYRPGFFFQRPDVASVIKSINVTLWKLPDREPEILDDYLTKVKAAVALYIRINTLANDRAADTCYGFNRTMLAFAQIQEQSAEFIRASQGAFLKYFALNYHGTKKETMAVINKIKAFTLETTSDHLMKCYQELSRAADIPGKSSEPTGTRSLFNQCFVEGSNPFSIEPMRVISRPGLS